MTDSYILVASECVDELKILCSAVFSLNEVMRSRMIFLIIGAGPDQLGELFLFIDRIPVPVPPITLQNVIIGPL